MNTIIKGLADDISESFDTEEGRQIMSALLETEDSPLALGVAYSMPLTTEAVMDLWTNGEVDADEPIRPLHYNLMQEVDNIGTTAARQIMVELTETAKPMSYGDVKDMIRKGKKIRLELEGGVYRIRDTDIDRILQSARWTDNKANRVSVRKAIRTSEHYTPPGVLDEKEADADLAFSVGKQIKKRSKNFGSFVDIISRRHAGEYHKEAKGLVKGGVFTNTIPLYRLLTGFMLDDPSVVTYNSSHNDAIYRKLETLFPEAFRFKNKKHTMKFPISFKEI